jgi:hypothetical protein
VGPGVHGWLRVEWRFDRESITGRCGNCVSGW